MIHKRRSFILITINSFCPINTWHEISGTEHFLDGRSAFVEDEYGERFINNSNSSLRNACVVNAVIIPIFCLFRAGFTLFRVASFYRFWAPDDKNASIKQKCVKTLQEIARAAATPITVVAVEIAAIWGLFRPKDGRKLVSNIVSLGIEEQSISMDAVVKAFAALEKWDEIERLPPEEKSRQRNNAYRPFMGNLRDEEARIWNRGVIEEAIDTDYFFSATERVKDEH